MSNFSDKDNYPIERYDGDVSKLVEGSTLGQIIIGILGMNVAPDDCYFDELNA